MITGLSSTSNIILINGKNFRIIQIGTIKTQVIHFTVEIIAEHLVRAADLPFLGCKKINRIAFGQQLLVCLDPLK